MNRQIRHSALVVGLGRFGSAAAERLTALGWEVVGVDIDGEVVQSMRDRIGHVVQLDARDIDALATLDIPGFEVCIVSRAAGIESSILLVLNLQQLGATRILAKAASEQHARILRRLGLAEIVFPERDAGVRLAESIQAPNLVQWIDLEGDREVAVLVVPEHRVGTRLREWREIQRPSVYVLGRLTRDGRPREVNRDEPLLSGEVVIVVGPVADIMRLAASASEP
ncbi:MAG: potassium channel family protein [Armatimonadota bacterium]